MGLEHALLVSLAERAASGLELTRRFDASIGFFWQASHQQIYRTLRRMESDGWVTSEAVAQVKRPAKLVYEVTAAGHEEVRRWLGEPTAPSPQRSELAVKLRGAWLGDTGATHDTGSGTEDANDEDGTSDEVSARNAVSTADHPAPVRAVLLVDVRRHLAEHVARLEHYRRGCERDYPDPQALSGGDLDRYLVLRGGILQEEAQVAWLTQYLATFGDVAPKHAEMAPDPPQTTGKRSETDR